jgi:hypothetical protein
VCVAAQAIGHTTPLALKVQNNHGGQKRKIQWMLISDFLKLGKKTFLVSCSFCFARLTSFSLILPLFLFAVVAIGEGMK